MSILTSFNGWVLHHEAAPFETNGMRIWTFKDTYAAFGIFYLLYYIIPLLFLSTKVPKSSFFQMKYFVPRNKF